MGQPPPGLPASGPAPAAIAVVTMPTWTPRPTFEELGIVGWFRARLGDIPLRPDRSATLRSEGGGRLDRLDLFLVVMLVVGTLVLRTYRLDEPYQMHFDEVYHARTATEFLQDWRYGMSHDVYEWTHPHLAKYAMAGGLVLWGEDDVTATSDLEVPVRAVAVEPRRIGRARRRSARRRAPPRRDRDRDPDLRPAHPPAHLDHPRRRRGGAGHRRHGNQLVIGYDDGRIATLDLTAIAIGGVGVGPPTIEPLATVDHPVDHLLVTDDGGFVVAASTDRLTTVDLNGGTVVGSLDLAAIADLAPGGSGPALMATVDDVADPSAAASTIADILSTDAADYASRLAAASPGTTVVLGDPGTGDARTKLDTAIANGTLPGITIGNVSRIAVATADGVAFVDPVRASVVSTILLNGGAHGLAMVTGLDSPKLYATAGDAGKPIYEVIAVGGDAAKNAPADQGANPLPGPGTLVAYDEASQQVHILGLAPGATAAGPWTVYVVEPHGNAVYADARLPDGFVPAAWGADFNPTTRRRIASSCSCSTATGPPPRSTRGRMPSPGACPGSSPAR